MNLLSSRVIKFVGFRFVDYGELMSWYYILLHKLAEPMHKCSYIRPHMLHCVDFYDNRHFYVVQIKEMH